MGLLLGAQLPRFFSLGSSMNSSYPTSGVTTSAALF